MGGFANNAPIVTDGLVFYVDAGNSNSYDSVSGGTTWSDLVGGNDGTLTNMDTNPANAGYTYDSANGGSIVFDGVDDYVDANYTGETSFPITLSCWVKFDAVSSIPTVMAISDASTDDQFFGMGVRNDSGTYVWRIYNYNTSFVAASSTGAVSTGVWYYITAVFTSNTSKKLYIDGVEVCELTTNTVIPTGLDKIAVGRFTRLTPGGYTDGNIACASVYNKALSSTEIIQNYNALKNRFI